MERRNFTSACLAVPASMVLLATRQAYALSLGDLSAGDAASGVRAALEQGASVAVSLLGRPDGFLGNPKVRIPLPGYLENGAKMLRMVGQGGRIDELVTAMNRAAEQAVPASRELLVSAVRSMSVADAKGILTGGETSVTQFFVGKTRAPLTERFLPLVTAATVKVQLADKYNRLAGKAADYGLVKQEDANIQRYVTGKSLDGLYLVIGEEERKIRQDPVGSGSAILRKVFGALR
ncbi:DUF4197 domain-containing protein [Variovorax ginsengisoli]|uniref:DUF4197 domain-containing protein n=1 Tax=Variovorax ginsengisoli TaxID=363844 RepID=A0ABT9SAF6_9BURK|nr:DUF4197 domain-containing protein [Variovorax ginsengisoli]MDP9901346.1 hypothetical protein [Variovorax ginsengisoli]